MPAGAGALVRHRRPRAALGLFVEDDFESVPRRDQRQWGECYLRGLMLDDRRKSIQPMAERLPDGNMQALQQFVNQSPWDPLPVRRRIAERLCEVVRPFGSRLQHTLWVHDGASHRFCLPPFSRISRTRVPLTWPRSLRPRPVCG
nr:transposase [Streptomyces pseudovenezuelae]